VLRTETRSTFLNPVHLDVPCSGNWPNRLCYEISFHADADATRELVRMRLLQWRHLTEREVFVFRLRARPAQLANNSSPKTSHYATFGNWNIQVTKCPCVNAYRRIVNDCPLHSTDFSTFFFTEWQHSSTAVCSVKLLV
jgi:hypothetical protein